MPTHLENHFGIGLFPEGKLLFLLTGDGMKEHNFNG
jgi:hypothetical protein